MLVDPAFMLSVVGLVICPTPPRSLPRTKVPAEAPEGMYWPMSISAVVAERSKEDVNTPFNPVCVLKIPARLAPVGAVIEESFILNIATWSATSVVAPL